jgi:hypothetical protein
MQGSGRSQDAPGLLGISSATRYLGGCHVFFPAPATTRSVVGPGTKGEPRGCRNVTVGAWFTRTPQAKRTRNYPAAPEFTQFYRKGFCRGLAELRWNRTDKVKPRRIRIQVRWLYRSQIHGGDLRILQKVNSGTSAGVCNIEADAARGEPVETPSRRRLLENSNPSNESAYFVLAGPYFEHASTKYCISLPDSYCIPKPLL